MAADTGNASHAQMKAQPQPQPQPQPQAPPSWLQPRAPSDQRIEDWLLFGSVAGSQQVLREHARREGVETLLDDAVQHGNADPTPIEIDFLRAWSDSNAKTHNVKQAQFVDAHPYYVLMLEYVRDTLRSTKTPEMLRLVIREFALWSNAYSRRVMIRFAFSLAQKIELLKKLGIVDRVAERALQRRKHHQLVGHEWHALLGPVWITAMDLKS